MIVNGLDVAECDAGKCGFQQLDLGAMLRTPVRRNDRIDSRQPDFLCSGRHGK
jgi:hypothetical protein